MVSVTLGQTFPNLGKNHKTTSVSYYCRKSRGTERNHTPGDRQSHYKDCHILQNESRRIPGLTDRECLSKGYCKGYCTLARTLRGRGTAHNDTGNYEGIFLATEDYCYAILLMICQIRGFRASRIQSKGLWK
jgi:hypothetical protein